jgi:hypothetical protein
MNKKKREKKKKERKKMSDLSSLEMELNCTEINDYVQGLRELAGIKTTGLRVTAVKVMGDMDGAYAEELGIKIGECISSKGNDLKFIVSDIVKEGRCIVLKLRPADNPSKEIFNELMLLIIEMLSDKNITYLGDPKSVPSVEVGTFESQEELDKAYESIVNSSLSPARYQNKQTFSLSAVHLKSPDSPEPSTSVYFDE